MPKRHAWWWMKSSVTAVWGLFALAAADGGSCAFAQVPTPTVPTSTSIITREGGSEEPDLLFLEVRLRNFVLSSEMSGFIRGSSLMLPLGQLTQALEFAISVDPQARRARGWFIREDRLFSLTLQRQEAVIGGRITPVPPERVEVREGDIFVDVRALSSWFPVDIEFDLANLLVRIESREPLPVEERLAREAIRARLGTSREVKQLPPRDKPYEMFTVPMVDVSTDLTVQRRDEKNEMSYNYSALATGDAAGMSSETFVAGSKADQLAAARLELSKTDPNARLFGPLDATHFGIGDITSPKIPLVTQVRSGRGAIITNLPVNTPTEFDRITLEGNLLSGWEVELYRNEVLLEFRTSQPTGRYLFTDVPLLFGVNVLRLVFYGPQGQRREETRTVRVGQDQVRPGETTYRLSANQHERPIFSSTTTERDEADQGKGRFSGELERGLSQNVSLAASTASIPTEDGEQRSYGAVGARAYVGDVAGRADVIKQYGGGTAGTLAGQTTVLGYNVIVDHTRFVNFLSEEVFERTDPLIDRSNVRLEGVLNPPLLPRLPFNIRARHDRRESGDYTSSLSNRVSFAFRRLSFTNDSTWRLSKSDNELIRDSIGALTVGGLLDPVRVRGQLAYTTTPEAHIDSAALTADWPLSTVYGLRASLSHQIEGEQTTSGLFGVNAQYERFTLGGDIFASIDGEYGIRFGLNVAFGRNPQTGSTFLSGRPVATSGLIASKVFLDNNRNGFFDDGDEPLRDVSVSVDGRPELKAKTDEDGNLLLTGLTPYRPINVGVADSTLEDPYWIPDHEGFQVIPRPGIVETFDFPITQSGEIDGTVFQKRGIWAGAIADARIQLIDSSDAIVREVKSAFDGFYLFEFVRPGTYTVRIDPDQLKRLNITQPTDRTVVIGLDGTIVSGQDFVLEAGEIAEVFRVLLGNFVTRPEAEAGWLEIAARLSEELKGLNYAIEEGRTPDGGAYFRLYAENLPSRDAAERLCNSARASLGPIWCQPVSIEVQ